MSPGPAAPRGRHARGRRRRRRAGAPGRRGRRGRCRPRDGDAAPVARSWLAVAAARAVRRTPTPRIRSFRVGAAVLDEHGPHPRRLQRRERVVRPDRLRRTQRGRRRRRRRRAPHPRRRRGQRLAPAGVPVRRLPPGAGRVGDAATRPCCIAGPRGCRSRDHLGALLPDRSPSRHRLIRRTSTHDDADVAVAARAPSTPTSCGWLSMQQVDARRCRPASPVMRSARTARRQHRVHRTSISPRAAVDRQCPAPRPAA